MHFSRFITMLKSRKVAHVCLQHQLSQRLRQKDHLSTELQTSLGNKVRGCLKRAKNRGKKIKVKAILLIYYFHPNNWVFLRRINFARINIVINQAIFPLEVNRYFSSSQKYFQRQDCHYEAWTASICINGTEFALTARKEYLNTVSQPKRGNNFIFH